MNILQTYFQKTEYFKGKISGDNSDQSYEYDCELITDRLNHHEVILKCETPDFGSLRFFSDPSSEFYLIEGELESGNRICIKAMPKKARNSTIYFRCLEVYRFSDSIEENLKHIYLKDDITTPTIHFAWYLPDYYEVGWKNEIVKHSLKGLMANVINSLEFKGEPEWGDIAKVNVNDEQYQFSHFLHFAESNFNDTVINHVISDVRVSLEFVDVEFPQKWPTIKKRFDQINDKFTTFHLAFRFLYGYRLTSYAQVLFYYDPTTKRYVSISRDRSTNKPRKINAYREKTYNGHWDFIEEFVQKYLSLEPEIKTLTKRCIERYSEAMEAPYLELKLTLLHSALSIFLERSKYKHDEFETISQELPEFDKRAKTLRYVSNFIAINDMEWKDLIPEGYEKSLLFEFNTLRNAYLKRPQHEITDITPIRLLQKLFERVLLTEMGVDFQKYKSLLGKV